MAFQRCSLQTTVHSAALPCVSLPQIGGSKSSPPAQHIRNQTVKQNDGCRPSSNSCARQSRASRMSPLLCCNIATHQSPVVSTAQHSLCSIILCTPNFRLYQQRTEIRNTATYKEGKIARKYIMTGIRIHTVPEWSLVASCQSDFISSEPSIIQHQHRLWVAAST